MRKFTSTVVLLAIAIAFIACGRLYSVGDMMREFLAAPAVAALFLALFTLIRDETRHQKDLMVEAGRQQFTVAASSHMATVAFDRHVDFCDTYLAKLDELIASFLLAGAQHQVIHGFQKEIATIRRKFSVWETTEIGIFLDQIDAAIEKIRSSSFLLETSAAVQDKLKRHEELYSAFHTIVSFSKKPEDKDLRRTLIEAMKVHIGAVELATLRAKVISNASK